MKKENTGSSHNPRLRTSFTLSSGTSSGPLSVSLVFVLGLGPTKTIQTPRRSSCHTNLTFFILSHTIVLSGLPDLVFWSILYPSWDPNPKWDSWDLSVSSQNSSPRRTGQNIYVLYKLQNVNGQNINDSSFEVGTGTRLGFTTLLHVWRICIPNHKKQNKTK